jgi:voltage-gated sodium channel
MLKNRTISSVEAFFHSNFMHWIIVILVVCNGVVLGLKTNPEIFSAHGPLLMLIDRGIIYALSVEILLRLLGTRLAFFRRGWNLFDAAIILLSFYAIVYQVHALDALRLFLMFRLVELLPEMNRLVLAMKKAIGGVANSVVLLLIVFYTFSVAATYIYGHAAPDKFADAGAAMLTMLQIMTFDNLGDTIRPLQAVHPLSWLFFVFFLILTAFSILNLVVGIVVQAMQEATAEIEKREDKKK